MLASAAQTQAQITTAASLANLPPYGRNTLPTGVRPRLVPNVNGLTVNMLEAGTQGRPLVLPDLRDGVAPDLVLDRDRLPARLPELAQSGGA